MEFRNFSDRSALNDRRKNDKNIYRHNFKIYFFWLDSFEIVNLLYAKVTKFKQRILKWIYILEIKTILFSELAK